MTRELLQRCLVALNDAHESIGDWGAYASDYFQEKWHLEQDCVKYAPLLADLRAALEQPPVAYHVRDAAGRHLKVEEHLTAAEDWLRRGIAGRTIEPIY